MVVLSRKAEIALDSLDALSRAQVNNAINRLSQSPTNKSSWKVLLSSTPNIFYVNAEKYRIIFTEKDQEVELLDIFGLAKINIYEEQLNENIDIACLPSIR